MPQPEYLLILAKLRSLAYEDSPLLTMHEREDVLDWSRRAAKRKAEKLWALVQERKPTSFS